MCEYCGCQEVPAIALLTAEHDAVVALMAQATDAMAHGDADGAARVCKEILVVLGPHTTVEEQGLFPAMRNEFADQVEALHAKTGQISFRSL